jgi:hypothetical protein
VTFALAPYGKATIEKLPQLADKLTRRWIIPSETSLRPSQLAKLFWQPWGTPDGEFDVSSNPDVRVIIPRPEEVFPGLFLVEQRIKPVQLKSGEALVLILERVYEQTPYTIRGGSQSYNGITFQNVSVVTYEGQALPPAPSDGFINGISTNNDFGRVVTSYVVVTGQGIVSLSWERDWRQVTADAELSWGSTTTHISTLLPEGQPSPSYDGYGVLVSDGSSPETQNGFTMWRLTYVKWLDDNLIHYNYDKVEEGVFEPIERKCWQLTFPEDATLNGLYPNGWSRSYEAAGWITVGKLAAVVDATKFRNSKSERANPDGSIEERITSTITLASFDGAIGTSFVANAPYLAAHWASLPWPAATTQAESRPVAVTSWGVDWGNNGLVRLSVSYHHLPVSAKTFFDRLRDYRMPGHIDLINENGGVSIQETASFTCDVRGNWHVEHGEIGNFPDVKAWCIYTPANWRATYRPDYDDGSSGDYVTERGTRPGYICNFSGASSGTTFNGVPVSSFSITGNSYPNSPPQSGSIIRVEPLREYIYCLKTRKQYYSRAYFQMDANYDQ